MRLQVTTPTRSFACLPALCVCLLALAAPLSQAATGPVVTLRVADVIGPASADFIERGLDKAADDNARLVVIELDTPGGLDTSMRQIIKAILASPVPVATFVGPEGARAASAGTFILYASHIAAMAPATNLGAATPVSIGGGTPGGGDLPKAAPKPDAGDEAKQDADGAPAASGDAMSRKVMNDAAAYIRSLAELRGRNADWAEKAVREAASLSAEDAKKNGVIEYIAENVPDLLRQVDGLKVKLQGGEVTLATANAPVELVEPDWRNRVLSLIANPQVAVVLMLIGVYGLFFEFTSPGFGVPGVAGAILLLLGLFAFQLLPINWAGVALIGVGAVLMLAEAFLPSFGVLGVGGIVAMILGGLFLFDADVPGFGVPLPLIIGLTLSSAIVIFGIGSLAARTRSRAIVSGREELVGSTGTLVSIDGDGAYARVHGEMWRVRGPAVLKPGDAVRVRGLDGLTLDVEPLESRVTDNQRT